MAWKYGTEDDLFEIVLGPISLESLMALAGRRVTYVVDTPANKQIIDACGKAGAVLDLYEVNRSRRKSGQIPDGCLTGILESYLTKPDRGA